MDFLRTIFWNSSERRVRAGWRLLIQFVLFIAALLVSTILTGVLGKTPLAIFVGTALYLLLGVGAVWVLARFLDHRPFGDYGFHWSADWWLDLAFGLLLGALLMSGVFVTESLAGWVRVTEEDRSEFGLSGVLTIPLLLLVYLTIAVNEELMFRGYQLRNLAEGFCGRRFSLRGALLVAWLVSSVFFGLSHVFNPNASLPSTLNIVLAGVLLSLPYLLTGELAVSIGVHLTWNLFQGSIYGYAVSGQSPTRRLLVPHEEGPELWTGGEFGPEAGLLGTIWIVLGCGLILLWVWLRRKPVVLQERLAQYEPPSPTKSVEITADPYAVHKG